MAAVQKTEQLQVRISPAQKLAIKRRAAKARMGMSEWILSRVFPSGQAIFQGLAEKLADATQRSYAFAELLDFFAPLDADAFETAVSEPSASLTRSRVR